MAIEPQQPPDPLMNNVEVAERLRRSVPQVRWMRHNGTGPKSALIAGRVMYRTSDVERFIAESGRLEEAYGERFSCPGYLRELELG